MQTNKESKPQRMVFWETFTSNLVVMPWVLLVMSALVWTVAFLNKSDNQVAGSNNPSLLSKQSSVLIYAAIFAGVTAYSSLKTQLAFGGTRKTYLLGLIQGYIAGAVALATGFTVLSFVEHGIYAWLDIPFWQATEAVFLKSIGSWPYLLLFVFFLALIGQIFGAICALAIKRLTFVWTIVTLVSAALAFVIVSTYTHSGLLEINITGLSPVLTSGGVASTLLAVSSFLLLGFCYLLTLRSLVSRLQLSPANLS